MAYTPRGYNPRKPSTKPYKAGRRPQRINHTSSGLFVVLVAAGEEIWAFGRKVIIEIFTFSGEERGDREEYSDPPSIVQIVVWTGGVLVIVAILYSLLPK